MSKNTIIISAFFAIIFFGISTTNVQASGCLNLSTNLRYGSSGTKDVSDLQQFLAENGYLASSPTGFFGKLTQAGVKKFQLDNKLPSTGLVGPMTRGKISELSCSTQAAVVTPTPANTGTVLGTSTSEVVVSTPTPTPALISLPYTTFDFADWNGYAGQVTQTSQGLELKAVDDVTVAIAGFPKASELTNYKLSVSSFIRRGTMILMARFKDDQNYVACYFTGRGVEIVQKVNGEQTSLANTDMPDSPYSYFFFNDIDLSMTVKGNTVGCTMLGADSNVTSANIDNKLYKGAPAVQVWYDAQGVANALVRKVSVQAI